MPTASISNSFAIRLPIMVAAMLWLAVSGEGQDGVREVNADWQDALSKESITAGENKLNYRLYQPPVKAGEDSATPYPLVLFLHGAGERGVDNEAQLKHGVSEFMRRQGEYPCFLVVPQCPTQQRWVERNWSEATGEDTFEEAPSAPMELALAVVEELVKQKRVDPKRLYVTGLSMGGYGTWYAAGFKGSPFAAAAPICGGGDPLWAERYRELPLWAFHGDADGAVPVARSREMIAAIKQAGGQPKYTEYPGVGHDSWTRTYQDDAFHQWLFSQAK
ncbi:prolyl oligopeptidase family serine peptidase [Planctomycetaceae bacterium SH139]